MKRTPLRRKTPLTAREPWPQRRTRIRQRSAKQAAKDRVLAVNRELVYERDVHCQARDRLDGHHCVGSLHVHHILPRARGGTHDLSNLVLLCDGAHRWVHAHSTEAALFGLIELTEADQ